MDARVIATDDPACPARLRAASGFPMRSIAAVGNLALLQQRTLALLCSVRCPGDVILGVYDLALALRQANVPVVGGFQSPMERECLRLLLRGTQPIVICPARAVASLRTPAEWKKPLEQGRLLVLSPFTGAERRKTTELAQVRNRFVAALADVVLVAHATPGGKLEALCRARVKEGKLLLALESEHNANLIAMGARVVRPGDVGVWSSEVAP